jgi:hypothetical protein
MQWQGVESSLEVAKPAAIPPPGLLEGIADGLPQVAGIQHDVARAGCGLHRNVPGREIELPIPETKRQSIQRHETEISLYDAKPAPIPSPGLLESLAD